MKMQYNKYSKGKRGNRHVFEGWITGYYGGGLEDIVDEAPTIIEKE